MKLIRKEQKNWNFDFSIYEREQKDEQRIFNTKKAKRKPVTTHISKFNPTSYELENITNIKLQISMKAIKVASYTQDIKDLWDMYGCLNEYWARIYDIFGSAAIKEIAMWQKFIVKNLLIAEKRNIIPYSLHRSLLRLRDKVYFYAQRVNLGIQTVKAYGSGNKAKTGIVE